MRRREFLIGVIAAVSTPRSVFAQQAEPPVVGYLNSRGRDGDEVVVAFRQGLRELGYVEGRNVSIEYRWAENQYEQIPLLLADRIRKRESVIAVSGPAALPAKAATKTIPVVFVTGDDPVKIGLVASLNRPGGNVTGIVTLGGELGSKRLETLHQLLPDAKMFALLVNPSRPTLAETTWRAVRAGANTLGLQVHLVNASTAEELESAIQKAYQLGAEGLVIGVDAFFNGQSEPLAALLMKYKLPAIYQYRDFAMAGGLLSYGGDIGDLFRLSGNFCGRILMGESPAEMPVQQSTKVALIINIKTAQTLGLTVPISLLGRADEVIE